MKLALIGKGYWGAKIFAILQNNFLLPIVCDPRLDLDNYPHLELAEILRDKKITHCFIATPESTHYELVKACLLKNKHVFVEKPLCLSYHQAHELVSLAKNKQLILFVDYIFLHDPVVKIIKEKIKLGLIGEVKQVQSIRWSGLVNKSDIVITDDLLIHDLYLARFLLSESKRVEIKKIIKNNSTVTINLNLKLENEIIYQTSLAWNKSQPQRTMQIVGNSGNLLWEKYDDYDQISTRPLQQILKIDKLISPLEKSINYFLKLTKTFPNKIMTNLYKNYLQDVFMLESAHEQYNSHV